MIRYYEHLVMPTYSAPYPFTLDDEKWCVIIDDKGINKESLRLSLEQNDQIYTDNPDILKGLIKILDVLNDHPIIHIGNDVVCRCGNICQNHFHKSPLDVPMLAVYRYLTDSKLHIFTTKCRKCGTRDWRITARDHSYDYVIYSNDKTIYTTDGKYDA